ncbi:MAG: lysophospholipid acyltransferase family protein [Rhodoferax sp.]|nr:lysophospholipid acyltransferase family protein [Rhodoferax sp.]
MLALGRLLRMLVHVGVGLWTIYRRFPGLEQSARDAAVQAWAHTMLACLGVKLQVHGPVPEYGPVLLAANHISWLDILVMHAARHCRFISKSDIQHWPLIGTLATAGGTLYITRESRRDALRVVHHMVECLRAHEVLAVFPEGTTGDGAGVLPFHANLFQAAISADAPVVPVGLRFINGRSGLASFAPCYIGDDTLIASVWRTLRARDLVAVVHFGTAQTAAGRDRRAWAADLRSAVIRLRAIPG